MEIKIYLVRNEKHEIKKMDLLTLVKFYSGRINTHQSPLDTTSK